MKIAAFGSCWDSVKKLCALRKSDHIAHLDKSNPQKLRVLCFGTGISFFTTLMYSDSQQ